MGGPRGGGGNRFFLHLLKNPARVCPLLKKKTRKNLEKKRKKGGQTRQKSMGARFVFLGKNYSLKNRFL